MDTHVKLKDLTLKNVFLFHQCYKGHCEDCPLHSVENTNCYYLTAEDLDKDLVVKDDYFE